MYRFALICLISFSLTESTSNDTQWLASVAKQRNKGLKKWSQAEATQSSQTDWSTRRLLALLPAQNRLNNNKKPKSSENKNSLITKVTPAHTIKKIKENAAKKL